jgi:hypothetical protein
MPTYNPDHNGECLHCDEWYGAHLAGEECPPESLDDIGLRPWEVRTVQGVFLCVRYSAVAAHAACAAFGKRWPGGFLIKAIERG